MLVLRTYRCYQLSRYSMVCAMFKKFMNCRLCFEAGG